MDYGCRPLSRANLAPDASVVYSYSNCKLFRPAARSTGSAITTAKTLLAYTALLFRYDLKSPASSNFFKNFIAASTIFLKILLAEC
jgi:hypothetical protein